MQVSVITATQTTFKSQATGEIPTARGLERVEQTIADMERDGIDLTTATAATSKYSSNLVTVAALKIPRFVINASLDRQGLGVSAAARYRMIGREDIPEAFQRAVNDLLDEPPKESIWVVDKHFALALTVELGLSDYEGPPGFAERRIMEI